MFEWLTGAIGSWWEFVGWMNPFVLLIMFVNLILAIVIIVKLINLAFGESYVNASDPVPPLTVRMYYSDNCGHCLRDKPLVKELAKEMSGITFEFVNGDTQQITGLMGFPTYVATNASGVGTVHVGGFGSKEIMKAWIVASSGISEEAIKSSNVDTSSSIIPNIVDISGSGNPIAPTTRIDQTQIPISTNTDVVVPVTVSTVSEGYAEPHTINIRVPRGTSIYDQLALPMQSF